MRLLLLLLLLLGPQVFDAIVGDPPYGVRAGGRKSKCKPDVMIRDRTTYIPSTAPYPLTECLSDLLELAAVLLVTGGWAPLPVLSARLHDLLIDAPTHSLLQLLGGHDSLLTAPCSLCPCVMHMYRWPAGVLDALESRTVHRR